MMSELSARLLAGSGITFAGASIRGGAGHQTPAAASTGGDHVERTTSGMSQANSSGYAGDVDHYNDNHQSFSATSTKEKSTKATGSASSTGPPSYIQMLDIGARGGSGGHHHHHHHHHHGEDKDDGHLAKRRKVHHSHHHHGQPWPRNAEANYVATNVREDLAKGGLAHKRPIGSTECVRPSSLFPAHSNVDMTRVSLLTSRDYEKLLKEEEEEKEKVDDGSNTGITCREAYLVYSSASDSVLAGLLRDCSGYYRTVLSPRKVSVASGETTIAVSASGDDTKSRAGTVRTTASSSSTSSLVPSQTSTELITERVLKYSSEGGGDEDAEVINDGASNDNDGCSQSSRRSARSEAGSWTSSMTGSDDGNNNEDVDGAVEVSCDATSFSPSSASFVRMGDALASSRLPRLIALPFKPFVVVHVNGPFTDLIGQSSIGVLGKPLHECFSRDPLVTAALQTSCAQFALANLDGQSINLLPNGSKSDRLVEGSGSSSSASSRSSNGSGGNNRRSSREKVALCTVRVSPIGQDGASGHITHYLLEVVQVGDKDLLEDDEEGIDCGPDAIIQRGRNEPSLSRSFSMGVMG